MLRCIICLMLIAATPASLVAADSGMAMLSSKGKVLRNGEPLSSSSAIFPGDLLETKADSVANLNALGSNVIILPGSLIEFDGKSLSVEHGSVSVATAHGISVRVRCMTVTPLSSALTQFEVSDVNGTIDIAARKNDVRLDAQPMTDSTKEITASRIANLREGEQTTRDESDGCKTDKRRKDAGAVPAGSGGILGSQWVKYGAIAVLGGVGVRLITLPDDAPSPWKP